MVWIMSIARRILSFGFLTISLLVLGFGLYLLYVGHLSDPPNYVGRVDDSELRAAEEMNRKSELAYEAERRDARQVHEMVERLEKLAATGTPEKRAAAEKRLSQLGNLLTRLPQLHPFVPQQKMALLREKIVEDTHRQIRLTQRVGVSLTVVGAVLLAVRWVMPAHRRPPRKAD